MDYSVVIPLYNHEQYIEETIESVLSQTVRPTEIIIIDDGSNDSSLEKAQAYKKKHPDLFTVIGQKNRGAHATINRGILMASSELISVLNSDDNYLEERFAESIRLFKEDPDLSAIATGIEFIDKDGKIIESVPWYENAVNFHYDNNEDFSLSLVNANFFMTTSNFIFKKKMIADIGLFADLRYAHDYDFFLKCIATGHKIIFHDKPLVQYRMHESNTIREDLTKVMIETFCVYAKFRKLLKTVNSPILTENKISSLLHKKGEIQAVDMIYNGLHNSLFANNYASLLQENKDLYKEVYEITSELTAGDSIDRKTEEGADRGNMLMNNHCKGEWFDTVCASIDRTQELNGYQLPAFPEEEIQKNTTGQAGIETLCEAYIFFEDCMEVFKQSKNLAKPDRKLMDFGVGWGRILRFFLKDFPGDQLLGVDINPELIEICRETFQFGSFIKSEDRPPLPIESQSVDFIVAYSVFSHLSEDVSMDWIKEFERILVPGGMLAFTTRGRWFFDYCETLKSKPGYAGALADMFNDFDEARASYDRGEFVHACGDGISGEILKESFYGESFIPENYAKRVYSEILDFVEFKYQPGRQTHPMIIFRKKIPPSNTSLSDSETLPPSNTSLSDSETLRTHAKSLSLDDWIDLVASSVASFEKPIYVNNVKMPTAPLKHQQEQFVGSSGKHTIVKEASLFYKFVLKQSATTGHMPIKRLLDFGCGWGRYTRLFLRDVDEGGLYGVDPMPLAIDLCRKHVPQASFIKSDGKPPLPFRDQYFDVVCAYSVFSHLFELNAYAWLNEIKRVLRPGGILVATTHAIRLLEMVERLRNGSIPQENSWHKTLVRAWVDVDKAKADYERGMFLEASENGEYMTGYGDVIVSPGYFEKVWGEIMTPVTFISDEARFPQAVFVMQRND